VSTNKAEYGGRLWTAEDLAHYFGLTPKTWRNKANKGEIEHLRIGQGIRFTPEQVKKIQRDLTVEKKVVLASVDGLDDVVTHRRRRKAA